jgi:hypothetical protein
MTTREDFIPLFKAQGFSRNEIDQMSDEEFVQILNVIIESNKKTPEEEFEERAARWRERAMRSDQEAAYKQMEREAVEENEFMDRLNAWRNAQGLKDVDSAGGEVEVEEEEEEEFDPQELLAAIPAEPESGVTIAIRSPECGRLQRKFDPSRPAEDV